MEKKISYCLNQWLLHFKNIFLLTGIANFFGTQRRRSHFSLPLLPYFPCLLSSIVWYIERFSLHCSSNWEIMDLINWSLNAIDTIEDTIEDIYLFGTMITGLLLIGLSFALGYRKIQKTGTAVQSLTRLPIMTEAVGRAVSIETETLTAIWILSWRSSRLCKRKLMIFEIRMDKESSCGIGMRLLA